MKRYQEDIKVSTNEGQPTRIIWRGKVYRVLSISDRWRYRGQWWCMEQKRSYYRVTVQPAHASRPAEMEIYKGNSGWVLSGVYD